MERNSNVFKRIFILVSILIPAVVAVLIFLPKGNTDEVAPWIFSLPWYNAIINLLTAILLVLGVIFVKTGRIRSHKVSMISAFILGSLFLVGYIIYHSNAPSTKFAGEGMLRYVYFFLLISHILLAIIVVPLVLSAVYFGVTQKIEKHKKMVKYTFPVWLYVSITGFIVYLMISPYYLH